MLIVVIFKKALGALFKIMNSSKRGLKKKKIKFMVQSLFFINETVSNGYLPETLDFFSIFMILFGIVVIISKNPIISVLFLISLFSCVASYLMTIGLSFMGLSYIIIYVGAVSILFLFILMLIDIRISELQNDTNNSIILSIIIGIYLYFILFILLSYHQIKLNNNNYNLFDFLINIYLNLGFDGNLNFVGSKLWDGNIATESSHIINIGNILYSNYSIWLILTSLILLLALIGTIAIVINDRPTPLCKR